MKSSIVSMRRPRSNNKQSNDQIGLLSHRSPPPSLSIWGVEDDLGLFPTTRTPDTYEDRAFTTKASIQAPSMSKPVSSQVPIESRFMPQHEPRKRHSPEDVIGGAALQFVPAYEESTSHSSLIPLGSGSTTIQNNHGSPPRKGTVKNTAQSPKAFRNSGSFDNSEGENGASWDAIIEADDSIARRLSWGKGKPKNSPNRENSVDRSISSAEDKSPPLAQRRRSKHEGSPSPPVVKARCSPTIRSIGSLRVLSNEEDEKSVISSSRSTVSSTSRRNTRVARLKQLFSSRAQVKVASTSPKEESLTTSKSDYEHKDTSQAKSAPTRSSSLLKVSRAKKHGKLKIPSSPSSSGVSGSSAGFAWPGTQDKRGKTVNIESSYDDSSVGPVAFQKKDYEEELERAAEVEMQKWMDEPTSFDESSIDNRNQLTILEQSIEHGPVNGVFEESDSDEEGENAADFHLAAVLADLSTSNASPISVSVQPRKSPDPPASLHGLSNSRRAYHLSDSRPLKSSGASSVATSASGALSIYNLFGNDKQRESTAHPTISERNDDPWDVEDSSIPPSSPGTSVSKESSSYLEKLNMVSKIELRAIDNFSSRYDKGRGIISILRQKADERQPAGITEEALAMNEKLSPPPRNFNANIIRGYDGYMNKTKDVPNLMDEMDSDSIESSAKSSVKASTSIYSSGNNAAAIVRRLPQQPSPNRSAGGKENSHLTGTVVDFDEESDVFDDISRHGLETSSKEGGGLQTRARQNGMRAGWGATPSQESAMRPSSGDGVVGKLNIVLLGRGLTTIQTTKDDFDNRATPGEFDENLSNSDIDQFGFARTPGFDKMVAAGRSNKDSAKFMLPVDPPTDDSDSPMPTRVRRERGGMFDDAFVRRSLQSSESGDSHYTEELGKHISLFSVVSDLSKYKVHPNQVKKLVRKYREMCRSADTDLKVDDLNLQEDSKKAFALTEMRSRITEKDIERGLERQGGTTTVDDLVLTPYNQAANRVRDAVIVSKAWRDGASPRDVLTASALTRRASTYFVKRVVRLRHESSPNKIISLSSDTNSVVSDYSYTNRAYTFEEVQWIDDTDFALLRCPSLGPRCMHGFEMFTIGDCQSILLKLTNERCIQLREELTEATAIQIDAEDLMKEEGDAVEGMMTDAEMIYLTAMEDVKTISKQLVVAERSFHLVRDRIEKLVAKYEALLIKIENESSVASASVLTYDSSYCSDNNDSTYASDSDESSKEREMFQRRVQRAELRAELAAREAMMAKQEAKKIKEEKQAEIAALEQKLAELQSESSFVMAQREHSAVLAKAITSTTPISRNGRAPPPKIDQEKVNGVKQRFRDRIAHRKHMGGTVNDSIVSEGGSSAALSCTPVYEHAARLVEDRPPLSRNHRHRLVGEEMFQHLDFYERSLRSVDDIRM